MAEKIEGRMSKKKTAIVEAAAQLFSRFGIRRVTVEEICRTAGASKTTFYKYFTNKIALVRCIWNTLFAEAYEKLDEIEAMEIPFPEKMRMLIEYKMDPLETTSPEPIDEVLHTDPELQTLYAQKKAESASRFMKFVREAQDRGEMRTMQPVLLSVILDKMKEIIENDDLRKEYRSDLDFICEVHDFFLFGVLPARGHSAGDDQDGV
jgi:AcrR family transcriptional regulator